MAHTHKHKFHTGALCGQKDSAFSGIKTSKHPPAYRGPWKMQTFFHFQLDKIGVAKFLIDRKHIQHTITTPRTHAILFNTINTPKNTTANQKSSDTHIHTQRQHPTYSQHIVARSSHATSVPWQVREDRSKQNKTSSFRFLTAEPECYRVVLKYFLFILALLP